MRAQADENPATLVVVDDDEAICLSLAQLLKLRRYRVQTFLSAEAALAWPSLPETDCILTDVKMPGMDGEEFLSEVLRRGYTPPVIMVTGHGDVAMAVRSLKAGAYDFVEKPFEPEVILASVKRAVEKNILQKESLRLKQRLELLAPGEDGRFGMIGRSRVMQDLFEQIEVVARVDSPVLVLGETGVGKELIARAIHARSNRAKAPFVALNAGAIAESLVESELFGHARGAFTGAMSPRDGKLLTATGGTLLLDEVESLSLKAQIQLLRVLEDGLVEPIGEDSARKIDIRLITTTKTNLQDLVTSGQMRQDFYHRIMVLQISVPALRERPEDIPILISHFLKISSERSGIPVPHIPPGSLKELLSYPWPGNVRELKNAIERMVVSAHQGVAGQFLQDDSFQSARLLSLPSIPGRLRNAMEKVERETIALVLIENHGEVTSAAQALGISRRALYERMKKYSLQKSDFKAIP